MRRSSPDTAAITGVGAIAPGRMGRDAFWELISAGRTATRTISSFDPAPFRSRVAAECEFDFTAVGDDRMRGADRVNQLAAAAAAEAWQDSGLRASRDRIGVVVGSAVGCTIALEREYVRVSGRGAHWLVDASRAGNHLHDHLVPSSIARAVAWTLGAEGPCRMVSNGCTSGLDVARHGLQMLHAYDLEAVVVVGADAPISPITVACFDAIKATSSNNDDPAHASRPFDRDRDGFVLGEGAAALVLEKPHSAESRNADIYARLLAAQSRANAYHMTGLRTDGRELAEAICAVLDASGLDADDIDYVNAHGSGTKQNDRHETAAVKTALGHHARSTPMSSIKSMIGHSLGAIGTLELAACALMLRHQFIVPTANYRTPDPECDLDYVPSEGRAARVRAVVSVGSGFGGFQSAVALAHNGWSV
ncbi:MAG: 3-oxoacyl-(acyl-carrier-protein) synthase [Amycolatopsis sp.]|jgi:act minimal PKS ketosynthase (KS/KS alpha)|uniref:beta-ketoacyl-[acyl-carrier-protein] synthase family protein n=1 Tax=Amycolatopsis sp. TaxID=37632 RepID=UPI002615C185|nr:beta-ketoacyl-[acyl-carrier-protein] synthase family protein [Amycolatopsis sp.]MCU1686718.1 3-oxoacyl-(acyl-carrier-protein) synthase [Amycolatopsis sp.]